MDGPGDQMLSKMNQTQERQISLLHYMELDLKSKNIVRKLRGEESSS